MGSPRPQPLPPELRAPWEKLSLFVISTDECLGKCLHTDRGTARDYLDRLVDLGHARSEPAGKYSKGEQWVYEDGTPVDTVYHIRRPEVEALENAFSRLKDFVPKFLKEYL